MVEVWALWVVLVMVERVVGDEGGEEQLQSEGGRGGDEDETGTMGEDVEEYKRMDDDIETGSAGGCWR